MPWGMSDAALPIAVPLAPVRAQVRRYQLPPRRVTHPCGKLTVESRERCSGSSDSRAKTNGPTLLIDSVVENLLDAL